MKGMEAGGSMVNVQKRSTLRNIWFWLTLLFVLTTLALLAISIAFGIIAFRPPPDKSSDMPRVEPSVSVLSRNQFAAVALDSAPCANVANYIMLVKRGGAVDAAIAGAICNGVHNLHSMGIGGGSFMVYYNKAENKAYTLDFREVAPLAATENMFSGKPAVTSIRGGLSIAVPGEVAGFYTAWLRFGKVPWKDLIMPTVQMLRNGTIVVHAMASSLTSSISDLNTYASPVLRELLTSSTRGGWVTDGDYIVNTRLADTLEEVSNNPWSMYNGTLAPKILAELQAAGSIITADDLKAYQPVWREPVTVPLLGTNLYAHSIEPPSSGAIATFAVNILSGFGYLNQNVTTLQDLGTYYHRLAEALKFAFATRSALGDMRFANDTMKQILQFIKDSNNAEKARNMIYDARTFPPEYYGGLYDSIQNQGTSHLCAIDTDGNAVSMTSSINYLFGSMVMGNVTGILYNDHMDDFSTPGQSNIYNLTASTSNYIRPGKKPMSSMSPLILTDKTTGKVQLVVGASGGSRIISAVVQVTANSLLLHRNVKEAIDSWRIHHQLYPNVLYVEEKFPKSLRDELTKRGHVLTESATLSVSQALMVGPDGFIYGNADYRKGGQASGL